LDDVHEIELFGDELTRLRLEPDDLLIVEGNGSLTEIGRCARWDGSIPNAVHQNHLIRARPLMMLGAFVEAWVNSPWGIDQLSKLAATTSGLYTLSVGKLARVPVPVPSLEEQKAIVAVLAQQSEALDDQAAAIEKALAMFAAQRQNILRAAFSGQLVPQNPHDEPASVLLERIRAQRPPSAAVAKRKPGRPAKVAA
jgi:type I restriction enzyme S subunit